MEMEQLFNNDLSKEYYDRVREMNVHFLRCSRVAHSSSIFIQSGHCENIQAPLVAPYEGVNNLQQATLSKNEKTGNNIVDDIAGWITIQLMMMMMS